MIFRNGAQHALTREEHDALVELLGGRPLTQEPMREAMPVVDEWDSGASLVDRYTADVRRRS